MSGKVDQRLGRDARRAQRVGAAEVGQVDHEQRLVDHGAGLAQQLRRRRARCRRWRSGRRPAARARPARSRRDRARAGRCRIRARSRSPIVGTGSLPGLRTGTKPSPSRAATAAPKMNPRASIPAIAAAPAPRGALGQMVDGRGEALAVGDQRGDVAELDARPPGSPGSCGSAP